MSAPLRVINNPKPTAQLKAKGVWIPLSTMRIDGLTWPEKMILATVTNMTADGGVCRASNRFFADLLGITGDDRVIRRMVSNLVKAGYLRSEQEPGRDRFLFPRSPLEIVTPDNEVRGSSPPGQSCPPDNEAPRTVEPGEGGQSSPETPDNPVPHKVDIKNSESREEDPPTPSDDPERVATGPTLQRKRLADCTREELRERWKVFCKARTEARVELIYGLYPRHVGKPTALTKIRRAIEKHGYDFIFERVSRFAEIRQRDIEDGDSKDFTPYPSTWFNQARYNDDEREWYAPESRKRHNGTAHQRNSSSARRDDGCREDAGADYDDFADQIARELARAGCAD